MRVWGRSVKFEEWWKKEKENLTINNDMAYMTPKSQTKSKDEEMKIKQIIKGNPKWKQNHLF
jgi:hypothetical protein